MKIQYRHLLAFALLCFFAWTMMQVGISRAPFSDNSGMIFTIIFFSLLVTSLIWAIYHLQIQLNIKDVLGSSVNSAEKQKRDRLDTVLRDLSDEDLVRLRQRLNDGSVDDDLLYEHIIGDDGELMRVER